jgi:hypothetical protein
MPRDDWDDDDNNNNRSFRKGNSKGDDGETKNRNNFSGDAQPVTDSTANGSIGFGLLAMVGAVVWFVVGLMNDTIFFYPPILFIIGLISFFKGIANKTSSS